MYANFLAGRRRAILSVGIVVLLSTGLAGCQTTQQQLDQDDGTCESFGARYGSTDYSQCMLVQQQRRDNESLMALEQARIATELSRSHQEIIDNRRQRDDN